MIIVKANDLTDYNLSLLDKISLLEHEARELRHDVNELENKVKDLKSIIKDNDRQRRPPEYMREEVFLRDKGACRYCGSPVLYYHAHFDHVYPYAHGGKTCVENLVTSCAPCNQKKGDKIGAWPRPLKEVP